MRDIQFKKMSVKEVLENNVDIDILINLGEDGAGFGYISGRDDGYEASLCKNTISNEGISYNMCDECMINVFTSHIQVCDSDNLKDAINEIFKFWGMDKIDEVPESIAIFQDYTDAIDLMKHNKSKYAIVAMDYNFGGMWEGWDVIE